MSRKKKRKSKKKLFIILTNIIFIILVLGIVIYLVHKNNILEKEKNRMRVVLKDNLEVEINSQVYLLSFIDTVKNGNIITEDMLVDTSKLGNKDLVVTIKNIYDEEIEYKFNILIKDTEKPIIKGKDKVTIYVGNDVDLLKGVTVSDNSLEEIKATVSGKYDIDKVGEYKLKYIAKDSSKNTGEYDFILNVVSDPNNMSFTTSKGFLGKVVNGVTYIDGVLIANKTYSLPSSYGNGLTKDTMSAFNKMKADATDLGLNIYISSGYRSYYDQKYIYENYVKRDGKEEADTYSARAGHSEHQTGLAFDLNTINAAFAKTEEGKWVSQNCYKYGLILRYPEGKSDITGYIYESWHLRYVGIELATKLYNDGDWLTLEEYYGIDSKYSN